MEGLELASPEKTNSTASKTQPGKWMAIEPDVPVEPWSLEGSITASPLQYSQGGTKKDMARVATLADLSEEEGDGLPDIPRAELRGIGETKEKKGRGDNMAALPTPLPSEQ